MVEVGVPSLLCGLRELRICFLRLLLNDRLLPIGLLSNQSVQPLVIFPQMACICLSIYSALSWGLSAASRLSHCSPNAVWALYTSCVVLAKSSFVRMRTFNEFSIGDGGHMIVDVARWGGGRGLSLDKSPG